MDNPDLTDAGRALLEVGANNLLGRCCLPGKVKANWKDIRALEQHKLVRFHGYDVYITDLGRRAIGAASQADATIAALRPLAQRRPLEPRPSNDPRTDFDYRSYRSMGWCCTLVVRQEDWRDDPKTIKVGRDLKSEPQFLGSRNSFVQPESEGRFVLAIVPGWMIRKNIFSGCPFPLDEDDPAFTADERALWDRLRNICNSINSRIRRGSGAPMAARSMGYGHTA